MNNRKSPIKHHQQQRMKNSHSIPIANTNRMRSNSSMSSSYPKNFNSYYRHSSNTNSPTTVSANSLPAVPLFYSNNYADPPDCSSLPQPPESWYLKPNDEKLSTPIVEKKEKPKQKSYYNKKNKGFYSPFHSSTTQTPYISVKA